jgi:hypothetical protein
MLRLTDTELEIVMDAARPLEPERRSVFLERVATELAAMPEAERGVGTVARLVRELHAEHFAAPDLSRGRTSRSRAY